MSKWMYVEEEKYRCTNFIPQYLVDQIYAQ